MKAARIVLIAVTVIGCLCSLGVAAISVYDLASKPFDVTNLAYLLVGLGMAAYIGWSGWNSLGTRRLAPAPRSVSEGCGSNHREAGDDV